MKGNSGGRCQWAKSTPCSYVSLYILKVIAGQTWMVGRPDLACGPPVENFCPSCIDRDYLQQVAYSRFMEAAIAPPTPATLMSVLDADGKD